MAISRILTPPVSQNKVIARNIVKEFSGDGLLPVIALEAFVEAGRTYQAYKRGGFDEARERITEEFSGAVFWLGGVTTLNAIFEKLGQKILKLPNVVVDTANDEVRNPLGNYLLNERKTTKEAGKILESTMAKFKFTKVIASVVLANAFIGFVLPKANQAITRAYHRKDKNNDRNTNVDAFYYNNPTNPIPTMKDFAKTNDDNKDKKNVNFGMNLLSLANKLENDRNWKLLSVDVGNASGRAISARNDDERIEVLFRDLSSIYFYMYNMPNINNWLNKLEQHGNGSRLDPVSAEYVTTYMNGYVSQKGIDKKLDKGSYRYVDAEQFKKDMFGKNVILSDSFRDKFTGDKIKIISLAEFEEELKTLVSDADLADYKQIAREMSELQPQLKGVSILTEGQVKAVLSGGHLNDPKFLKECFKNKFGNSFMNKYTYIAQNDLDSYKKQVFDYVESVVSSAKSKNLGEITEDVLRKASNNNLKMNALNWGAGFAISALFLSTLIPKIQYWITQLRTGSQEFPGTKEFRE